MKTIGLLGGVSWHSTIDYYRHINEITNQHLGENNSARMLIYSFNFQDIRNLHNSSEDLLCKRLIIEAQNLAKAGADCILIGANTLHLFYDEIQSSLNIPVIHIADAVGKKIKQSNYKKIILLGTAKTMNSSFYPSRLQNYNIQTILPAEKEIEKIDDIIFKELVKGIISESSKKKYIDIVERLVTVNQAEGVILGCTEIPLLIGTSDLKIPIFNSTEIHAEEAVAFALKKD